jgi:hypothetical protein
MLPLTAPHPRAVACSDRGLTASRKTGEPIQHNNERHIMKDRDTVGRKDVDTNPDPITGAPGSHPIGTGVGAAAGGAAGAAIGAVGGPVGAAVGMVAGAVAGGLGGKGVAEMVDPTAEEAYWRDEYVKRDYVDKGASYDTYRPAYRTGYEGFTRYPGRSYDEVEMDLKRDYEKSRGDSDLSWERAKYATRDAWHRVERTLPGDADGDGR